MTMTRTELELRNRLDAVTISAFLDDYLTCKWLSCLHKGEHWRFHGSEAVPSVVTIHQSLIIEDVRKNKCCSLRDHKTNALAHQSAERDTTTLG